MRALALLLAVLALSACTTEQIARGAASACRASPQSCTDRTAPEATRTPGL
ncbi:hypothetical protein [Falsiroseomonas ponticola]|jgi:hypothetical protein|uniref:hypothetical protein n=1 Tax=Falsiroseomonas ponticola TaxID=2786951 RepID=UPI001931DC40|nr:hypothetical protein [Roseomonas ponticola]